MVEPAQAFRAASKRIAMLRWTDRVTEADGIVGFERAWQGRWKDVQGHSLSLWSSVVMEQTAHCLVSASDSVGRRYGLIRMAVMGQL